MSSDDDAPKTSAHYTALVGGDGWLFINNIDNKFEKHTGKISLNPDGLTHWQRTLELRDRWIAGAGSRYYFIVAPSKASIYGRFLPPGFAGSPHRPFLRLKAHLAAHSSFRLIDPTDRLIALAEHHQVYHKTDAHWNDFGAYRAYRQLTEQIGRDLPLAVVPKGQFELRKREFIGELSAVLPEPYRERSYFILLRGAQATKPSADCPVSRANSVAAPRMVVPMPVPMLIA